MRGEAAREMPIRDTSHVMTGPAFLIAPQRRPPPSSVRADVPLRPTLSSNHITTGGVLIQPETDPKAEIRYLVINTKIDVTYVVSHANGSYSTLSLPPYQLFPLSEGLFPRELAQHIVVPGFVHAQSHFFCDCRQTATLPSSFKTGVRNSANRSTTVESSINSRPVFRKKARHCDCFIGFP